MQYKTTTCAFIYLQEAVGGMSYSAWQNLISKHGIYHRALSIRSTSKKRNLHVISAQNIPNSMYFCHKRIGLFHFVCIYYLLLLLHF